MRRDRETDMTKLIVIFRILRTHLKMSAGGYEQQLHAFTFLHIYRDIGNDLK